MKQLETSNQRVFQSELREYMTFKTKNSFKNFKCEEIIGESPNSKYLGLLLKNIFFLITNSGKTLFKVITPCGITSCCFSDDSQFTSVLFTNGEQQYIMVYDLENRKRIWIKIFPTRKISEFINFYKENLFCQDDKTMQVFTLDGQVKATIQIQEGVEQLYYEGSIKLNSQFMIYGLKKCDDKTRLKYYLFSMHNMKNCKLLTQKKSKQAIIKFSQYLFGLIPLYTVKKWCLISISGKMLRRFDQIKNDEIQRKYFIKDKLFLFDKKGYYEQNISSGSVIYYQFNCPIKLDPIKEIQLPYICVTQYKLSISMDQFTNIQSTFFNFKQMLIILLQKIIKVSLRIISIKLSQHWIKFTLLLGEVQRLSHIVKKYLRSKFFFQLFTRYFYIHFNSFYIN